MKSHNILIALPALFFAVSAMAAGNHSEAHSEQAIGKAGDASKITRTVRVNMTDDMRFHAPSIAVKQGETRNGAGF